jgi:hypothetical protein
LLFQVRQFVEICVCARCAWILWNCRSVLFGVWWKKLDGFFRKLLYTLRFSWSRLSPLTVHNLVLYFWFKCCKCVIGLSERVTSTDRQTHTHTHTHTHRQRNRLLLSLKTWRISSRA